MKFRFIILLLIFTSCSHNYNNTKILKSFPDFNEEGSKLAKSFVLFGGIYNYSDNAGTNGGRKGGVVPNLQERNNLLEASRYSYGLGSSEYALSTFPGLDSVKIVHVNRGAIRKLQLKLTVNNKDQLEIIETLYLRLGYYLLLEWGNTNYFDSKGVFEADPTTPSTAFNKFFEENDTALDVEKLINNSRVSSGGNYDGALFKVSNFSWSLNDDGSYSVNLSGISKGGLIDSLIVNSPNNQVGDNSILEDYAILNPDKDTKTKILRKLRVGTFEVDIDKVYGETVAKLLSNGSFNKLKEAGAIVPPESDQSTLNISGALNKFSDDSSITIADQNKSLLNQILL